MGNKEQQIKIVEEQLDQLKPFAEKFNSLCDILYKLSVVEFYSYIEKFWKQGKR